MGALKSAGVVLIIVGMIFALFAALDPRVKTPVFEGDGVKYVAYGEAVVTSGGVTETYEQVVLLVSGTVQLPDTKVTISGTAFPITSGLVYYFSGYYFYMPTYYTTAKYMFVGQLTFTNVYGVYNGKYERVRSGLSRAGVVLVVVGVLLFVAPDVKLPERRPSREKRKKEEKRGEAVEEDDEDEREYDFIDDEYEEVENVDIFIPPDT